MSDDSNHVMPALLGIGIILFSLHLSLFYVQQGETALTVYQIGLGTGAIGLVIVLRSFLRSVTH